jgi:hypothetical protein
MKSFKPKDEAGGGPAVGDAGGGRNAERDFHGEKRTNETHASTSARTRGCTARAWRSGTTTGGCPWEPATGKEAKLGHMGHLLMENGNGLIVDALLTEASGTAERDAAEAMLGRQPGRHRATLGAGKAYDTAGFVSVCARRTSPRTSPRTRRADARRSTLGPRATPAMPPASGYASGSRRASVGSRRWAACARPGTAAPHGSAGCSR